MLNCRRTLSLDRVGLIAADQSPPPPHHFTYWHQSVVYSAQDYLATVNKADQSDQRSWPGVESDWWLLWGQLYHWSFRCSTLNSSMLWSLERLGTFWSWKLDILWSRSLNTAGPENKDRSVSDNIQTIRPTTNTRRKRTPGLLRNMRTGSSEMK